jgi:hypothetical protein
MSLVEELNRCPVTSHGKHVWMPALKKVGDDRQKVPHCLYCKNPRSVTIPNAKVIKADG